MDEKEKIIRVYPNRETDCPLVLTDKGNLFLRSYHAGKDEYRWEKIKLPEEIQ